MNKFKISDMQPGYLSKKALLKNLSTSICAVMMLSSIPYANVLAASTKVSTKITSQKKVNNNVSNNIKEPAGKSIENSKNQCVHVKSLGETETSTSCQLDNHNDSNKVKRKSNKLKELNGFATPDAKTYTISYLSSLNYYDLADLLCTIDWEQIPGLFDFNDDTKRFYGDRYRIEALLSVLEQKGREYTAEDSKGIPTLVEVIRAAYFLGFHNPKELSYLSERSFHEKVIPAITSMQNNYNFRFGKKGQEEVIKAVGQLIWNGACNSTVVSRLTTVVEEFYRNIDTYTKDELKNNAMYQVIRGVEYDMDITIGKTDGKNSEWYGRVDSFANAVKRIALCGKVNEDNEMIINNALYAIKTLGKVHYNSTFGNEALTEAMKVYPYLSEQYMQAAQDIKEKYGAIDYYGREIDLDKIKTDAKQKLLPKTYIFDNGTLVIKAGDKVTQEKIKRLYWASKEVKAQFHRIIGNDKPLEEGNPDEVLTMVIYNNPQEYSLNRMLYGYDTNNGGMYIEGTGTFFTFERKTPEESSYTLEELFRHEFCHYLQGRYLVPGMWGSSNIYKNGRITWFEEGGAELFAGATRTEDIKTRASVVNNLSRVPSQRNTANESLHAQYGGDVYNYPYALLNYMYNKDIKPFNELVKNVMANDVTNYDKKINELSNDSNLNSEYQKHMQYLVDNYEKFTIPLVADDYLKNHTVKKISEVQSDIIKVTGLKDVKVKREKGEFFNTFTLEGIYEASATQGDKKDFEVMNEKTNSALKTLSGYSWSGYKTLTSYFTKINSTANKLQYKVVYHGILTDDEKIVIDNKAPNVGISGDFKKAVKGSEVRFTSVSKDEDGGIISYEWDFGDGKKSNDVHPIHIYKEAGTYNVTLTVTDNCGAKSTATVKAIVRASDNEIPIDPDVKYITKESETNNRYQDANGPIVNNVEVTGSLDKEDNLDLFYFQVKSRGTVNVEVDFGKSGIGKMNWSLVNAKDLKMQLGDPIEEGTKLSSNLDLEPGTYVLHVYNYEGTAGSYRINVKGNIGQADGKVTPKPTEPKKPDVKPTEPTKPDTKPKDKNKNKLPVVVINGPYSGVVGKNISFNSKGCSSTNGSIKKYLWDFGDGETSTKANPRHKYVNAGTYTVKLQITDIKGAVSKESATVEVKGKSNNKNNKPTDTPKTDTKPSVNRKAEKETNNFFEEAMPILRNESIYGSFSSDGDIDIYAFDVVQNGKIDIKFNSDVNDGGVMWYAYAENDLDNVIAYPKSVSELNNSFNAMPGKYYIYVCKNGGSGKSYDISVEGAIK